MAIFTAIAAAIGLTGFFATAFVTLASIATSIGLSYAAKALAGNKQTPAAAVDHFSVQGALQTSGDISRSFNLGYSMTAGSLVYANTWGVFGETPNAYLTQVIALSDLPGGTIVEVWINGELCTLGGSPDSDKGYPVTQYNKDGADHLWIKYYDGTQTTADSFLTGTVSSVDRPWESTRVGTGIAYAICTSLVEDTLFTGFPTFKFALSGVALYDPSKDSTNGGSGAHRYSDRTTWGGDGDKLPAVQIYNILRGFSYGGQWLYGLQTTTSARLPSANWIAQIQKCRATITGESGPEPTYRSGGQINVSAQSANAIEAILTTCQGRLSEIGGFYKLHLGAPDSTSFSFTDDDILSSEEQIYKPFFSLAESVNGIQGTYPDPEQGWNIVTAPAYYRTDLEVIDGDRRLMAAPSFDFVPYPAQVQRLQKSAIEEAQRARTHTIALPPIFWLVEPGDIGSWTSVRNGYTSKLFRVDAVVDKANLDVALSLTEIDPADYDWDHASEFTSVSIGSTVFPRPAPQGILDWFAEAAILYDADGIGRRPAIRLSWDGTLPGIVGVQYEVRLKSDSSAVTKGRTDQLSAGAIIVTQSLIPNTIYQVRGQYLPSSPRDMLWSDWLDVTTPDVKISILEFDAALRAQVTTIQDSINDRLLEVEQRISTLVAAAASRSWMEKKEVRSQISATYLANKAFIENVQVAYVDADTALASDITTVSAAVDANTASIVVNSSAIATLDGYAAAQYSVDLDVNGYASGFSLINGGAGFSAFVVKADKFQIQLTGYNSDTPVPIFTAGTINGIPAIGISANVYLDGTLNATALNVATLSAISADMGTLTAGIIKSSDNKFILDLADKSITISD